MSGTAKTNGPSIAIIGAGVSGICLAVNLKRAGIDDFVIYEKSDEVGGTWNENTYPGAACDVPSHLYSLSFEPNPNWTRKFPRQAEILDYFKSVARKYDVYRHVRFGTELDSATFDETSGQWLLKTRGGEETSVKVLISGCGQLNRPLIPNVPGLSDFAGEQFHSARWNHGFDVAGKRIAVIGNGPSAIQFIPEIAKTAEKVVIYHRTPNYVVPRLDRPYSDFERWLFKNVPGAARLYRWALYWTLEKNRLAFTRGTWFNGLYKKAATDHMAAQVPDPVLRAKLSPDYDLGCKRVLISDDWLPTLSRPNVEVLTSEVDRVTARSVVDKDGAEREVDAIIFGTGFESTKFLTPMKVFGLGGKPIDEAWKEGAEAHLGVTVAGYPNFFMTYGPNTNLGHNSIIFMIECQTDYIVGAIRKLRGNRLRYIDVLPGAMARYNEEVQTAIRESVWAAGCRSWYKTADGKVTNNWSGFTMDYWWRTRAPDFAEYRVEPAR